MVYTNHCCYHDTAPITVTMKTRTVLAVLEPKVGMYQNENAKVSKACQLCYITIRSLQGLLRVPLLRFCSAHPRSSPFARNRNANHFPRTLRMCLDELVNLPENLRWIVHVINRRIKRKQFLQHSKFAKWSRRFATDKGSSKLWLIRCTTQDFSNGILQVTKRKNNLRNLDVGQLTHSPEHVLSLSRINATWVPRNPSVRVPERIQNLMMIPANCSPGSSNWTLPLVSLQLQSIKILCWQVSECHLTCYQRWMIEQQLGIFFSNNNCLRITWSWWQRFWS